MSIYNVYAVTDDGDAGDEARFSRNHGCNGQNHVDDIYKVWFKDDGEVEHAEVVRTEEKGKCDGNCLRPSPTEGSFIYPSPKVTMT